MSVGADHGGGDAVEMPAHGDLFSCRLGVEIDKEDGRLFLQPLRFIPTGAERAVDTRHEGATLQVEHRHGNPSPGCNHRRARTDRTRGIVKGSQQALRARHEWLEIMPVPYVVAAGDDISAITVDFTGEVSRQAESAGGVLAVDNAEVDASLGAQFGDELRCSPTAGSSEDIGYKKNFQDWPTLSARCGWRELPE